MISYPAYDIIVWYHVMISYKLYDIILWYHRHHMISQCDVKYMAYDIKVWYHIYWTDFTRDIIYDINREIVSGQRFASHGWRYIPCFSTSESLLLEHATKRFMNSLELKALFKRSFITQSRCIPTCAAFNGAWYRSDGARRLHWRHFHAAGHQHRARMLI